MFEEWCFILHKKKLKGKSLAPSLKTGTIDNENDNSLILSVFFLLENPLKYVVPSCREQC